jgi:uncharacterized protein YlaN (UPF0358 family)
MPIKFFKLNENEYLQVTDYIMNNKKYLSGILITYNDFKPTWKHLKADKIPRLIKLSTKINKLPEQHKELTKTNTWMYGTHKEVLINDKLHLVQQQRDYKTNKVLHETIKEIVVQ